MKSIILISVLAAGSVLAGEKTPILEKSPIAAPSPDLYSWFAGATVGYLTENDTEMYTGHIGVDLPGQVGGWNQALYLEVGYAEIDERVNVNTNSQAYQDYQNYYGNSYFPGDNLAATAAPILIKGPRPGFGFSSLELQFFEGGYLDIEMEIVPVTLNYKLEKQVSPALNVYFGLGAGLAFLDADVQSAFGSDSDDDTVFFAQAFGGVLHHLTPDFEVFAGARVIYFEDPEFNLFGGTADLDDFSAVGFDVETTDVLIELGGRYNF